MAGAVAGGRDRQNRGDRAEYNLRSGTESSSDEIHSIRKAASSAQKEGKRGEGREGVRGRGDVERDSFVIGGAHSRTRIDADDGSRQVEVMRGHPHRFLAMPTVGQS